MANDGILDQKRRADEKQASRDRDQQRLAAGEVTAAELARENSFFRSFDLEKFAIESIGGRPLRRRRPKG
ncbi:conserved protein of unknown function (plasmid) [Rhodovastum atsumiense]|uniref:Uncharacterized protein n=1 Tax=Rhodovastum atsumiense TaxID=504468 RepID=A0A5M6IU55_9PROT|nr:hypothetical protein [Rhodovastum atsumiense]KAA5611850.1 hypothetical protein F1189_12515 [Rhodovastum atsumiense]CAH2606174.1 conserved protein of unknown function [Rhodovastum atsumiense]